ncbi:class I SAM-dependent methyltransferase [bacterium]|nr:class I SAM-dependent methyltransferase [bacterium]
MAYLDFISNVHNSTKRDYVQRVVEYDKAECAEVALQFEKDYWDGDRRYGFGGYYYDGRWRAVADRIIEHYKIRPEAKILDVGCGKGFLLYELTQAVPGTQVAGIDVSRYAIENSKEEIRPYLKLGNAVGLPFGDDEFDLVLSLNTLHNLYNFALNKALREIERVGKKHKYIVIESYRNEREKVNMLYWQLTCRSFYTPKEWEWFFTQAGYTGDYGCIFFE